MAHTGCQFFRLKLYYYSTKSHGVTSKMWLNNIFVKMIKLSTSQCNSPTMDRMPFCYYQIGGEMAVLPEVTAVLLHPAITIQAVRYFTTPYNALSQIRH
jgi:hypothetical protein